MRRHVVLLLLGSACAQPKPAARSPAPPPAAAPAPNDPASQDDAGPLVWRTLRANGVEVEYATIGNPGSGPVLLALPPGPQTREMVAAGLEPWADAMRDDGWFVLSPVSPQGLFFADSAATLAAFVEAAASAHAFAPEGMMLFGMSNGGMSAFSLAIADPTPFAAMVTMPGRPTDDDLRRVGALWGIPVTIVVGADDDEFWRSGAASAKSALEDAGGAVTLTVVPDTQHAAHLDYDWPALRALFEVEG